MNLDDLPKRYREEVEGLSPEQNVWLRANVVDLDDFEHVQQLIGEVRERANNLSEITTFFDLLNDSGNYSKNYRRILHLAMNSKSLEDFKKYEEYMVGVEKFIRFHFSEEGLPFFTSLGCTCVKLKFNILSLENLKELFMRQFLHVLSIADLRNKEYMERSFPDLIDKNNVDVKEAALKGYNIILSRRGESVAWGRFGWYLGTDSLPSDEERYQGVVAQLEVAFDSHAPAYVVQIHHQWGDKINLVGLMGDRAGRVKRLILDMLKQGDELSFNSTFKILEKFGEGVDISDEVVQASIYLLNINRNWDDIKRLLFRFPEIDFHANVLFDVAVKKYFVDCLKNRYYKTAIEMKKYFVSKIELSNNSIEGYDNLIRTMLQGILEGEEFSELRDIYFPEAKNGLADGVDISDVMAYCARIHPIIFIKNAERSEWRKIVGDDAMQQLLNVLPKRTDEKRNAFTHNQFDRTSTFFHNIASGVDGFELSPEEFRLSSEYIEKFGLANVPIVYKYFRNLKLFQAGKIDSLPDSQVAEGITSIEELDSRVKIVMAKVCGDVEMRDFSKIGTFEIELLSYVTGFSTHSFPIEDLTMSEVLEYFDDACKAGRIADKPPKYTPGSFSVSEAQIEFDPDEVRESFDVFSIEILNAIENGDKYEGLRSSALKITEKKIQDLMSRNNPALQQQLESLNELKTKLGLVESLDQLMGVLIETGFLGKNNDFKPIIRQIIFMKAFSKGSAVPMMMENLNTMLRGENLNGKAILGIINLVNVLVKDHVLNLEGDNSEEYWDGKVWEKIRRSEKDKKLVEIRKIFSPYIGKLMKAAENFKISHGDAEIEVKVRADRGLAGEMSGYLANACYTAEIPLLEKWPNVIPHKFVVGEEDGNPEFFGSMLVFELESKEGEKVLLVRAFNVPNEGEIDIEDFIEKNLDRIASIGRERGAKKVVIPGIDGAISNYALTQLHMKRKYISDKLPIALKEEFKFNGYDLTDCCFVVRDL